MTHEQRLESFYERVSDLAGEFQIDSVILAAGITIKESGKHLMFMLEPLLLGDVYEHAELWNTTRSFVSAEVDRQKDREEGGAIC